MNEKSVRPEWQHYLFEDEKDYSEKEIIDKLTDVFSFFTSRKMRVNFILCNNINESKGKTHLSYIDKIKYVKRFEQRGVSADDCHTVVKIMDFIYQNFELSKDEAEDITNYGVRNRLTLPRLIKDKLGVDYNEVSDYIDEVLQNVLEYSILKSVYYGDLLVKAYEKIK